MVMACFRLKRYAAGLSLCVFLCLNHGCGAAASPAISPSFISSARCHGLTTSPDDLTLAGSRHSNARRRSTILSATSDGNEKAGGGTSRSARERGIYARPSAAIERGSGFFIPGLEGSRIRFLFGITVLLADAANRVLVGGQPGDWGQVVAESLAALYGALLLLQGSIEMGVERGYGQGSDSEGTMSDNSESDGLILKNKGGSSGRVSDALQGDDANSRMIQRMAQTIINFTPATYFQLVDGDWGVLYSWGVANDEAETIGVDEQKRLANMSLDAVSGSRGGRVALPSDHPASMLLPQSATRCILVQKVNGYHGSQACMVIGSDKLLPSFTKNDLRWIGKLSDYTNLLGNK